jgi:hypothetical protein
VQGTLFGHAAGHQSHVLTIEEVADHVDAIFDVNTLDIVNDPADPTAAERDVEGMLRPKPYRPT